MASFRGQYERPDVFNSTGRGKINDELRAAVDEYKKKEDETRDAGFTKRVICMHYPINGMDIHLVKIKPERADANPLYNKETTFVCGGSDGCGEVIEMRTFTPEEVNSAIFMINSMLQQMKVMDNMMELSDETRADLRNLTAIIPGMTAAGRTYESMLQRSTGDNGNRNKKNRQKGNNSGKGGFGMPGGFGGHMYSAGD